MRCLHLWRHRPAGICWPCNLDQLARLEAKRRHPAGKKRGVA